MESRRGNNRNRGRVLFRNNYPNGGHIGNRSSGNPKKAFQNLRRSSIANINMVKEKLLTRRSGHYDDAKEALVKENNGIRIWYHNYTTIGMISTIDKWTIFFLLFVSKSKSDQNSTQLNACFK